MSIPRTSLRQAFAWSFIQHWGTRALTFVVFFILARILPPADFGLVALSSIVLGLSEIFIDQGFGDAIVQSDDESAVFLSTAFWVNIAFALALMAITLASAGWIARLFKEPRLAAVVRVISISYLFTGLSSVQVALLRRSMNYQALAWRMMTANVIAGITACLMAALGGGVWSLVVQQILFSFVSMVIVWRVGPFRPAFLFDRGALRHLLPFGMHLSATKVLDLLHTKLIDSLVGFYLGAERLGLYSVGNRLGIILMQLLGTSFADISLSHFSDVRREQSHLAVEYFRMTKRVSLISVPLFAFLAIESRDIIRLCFGQKWEGAAMVFTAYCAAGMVQVILYFSNSVITALGQPQVQMWLSGVKLALYTGAFFIFLSHGMAAIAWSLAGVTILVMAPLTLYKVAALLRCSGVEILAKLLPAYGYVCAASVATYLVEQRLQASSLVHAAMGFVVFFSVFGGLLLAFDKEARLLSRALMRSRVAV